MNATMRPGGLTQGDLQRQLDNAYQQMAFKEEEVCNSHLIDVMHNQDFNSLILHGGS